MGHLEAALAWLTRYAQGLAVVFGAAWAVWTFWMTVIWIPNKPAPSVNIEARLTTETPRRGLVPVRCDVAVENPTEREAHVFAAWLMLGGATMQQIAINDRQYSEYLKQLLPSADMLQRTVLNDEQKVMAVKMLPLSGLNPHEKRTNSFVAFVPADSFDVLRLHVWVVTQRRDLGLVPNFHLRGGGWMSEEPGKVVGSDSTGAPIVIGLTDSLEVVRKSGFVTSEARAELSLARDDGTGR